MTVRSITWFFACTLSATSLAAQAIHLVGPGGFAEIRDAIAAAAPGDVIRVASGVYGPFRLDRGLSIRATGLRSAVVIRPDATRVDTELSIPAGQQAHLCGLQFERSTTLFGPAGRTEIRAGSVHMERCSFLGPLIATTPNRLLIQDASVVAHDCEFVGDPAVDLVRSAFAAVQSHMLGAFANGFPGGDALHVVSSRVQLSNCELRGAQAAPVQAVAAGHGLVVFDTSSVSITDSTVIGGHSWYAPSLPAGDGLRNLGPSAVRHDRCWFRGGQHTDSSGLPLPGGQPTVGPALATGLLGISLQPPKLVLGETNVVEVTAPVGWPVFLFLASAWTAPRRPPPLVNDIVWVQTAGLQLVALGAASGVGTLEVVSRTPNDPALVDAGFWFCAAGGTAFPLHVTPPVGGLVRERQRDTP